VKETTRARVAAVVGAAANKKKISSIYDYSASCHRSISANIAHGKVEGYDYTTSTFFSGNSNNSLDFYDYGNSKHVNLKINGEKFDGYDYDTQKHFCGTVNGKSVSLYDYDTGKYYNYSI